MKGGVVCTLMRGSLSFAVLSFSDGRRNATVEGKRGYSSLQRLPCPSVDTVERGKSTWCCKVREHGDYVQVTMNEMDDFYSYKSANFIPGRVELPDKELLQYSNKKYFQL